MQPAVQKKAKLEELRDKLQEALAARDENAEEIRKEMCTETLLYPYTRTRFPLPNPMQACPLILRTVPLV